jgi:hypothetical protein
MGAKVTLVEAEPRLGGVCLLRGCIPSKALLHVARVLSEAKEMSGWGVKFETPQLDIDKMRSRKEKVIDTLSGGLKQLAKRRNVEVIHATGSTSLARRIDSPSSIASWRPARGRRRFPPSICPRRGSWIRPGRWIWPTFLTRCWSLAAAISGSKWGLFTPSWEAK